MSTELKRMRLESRIDNLTKRNPSLNNRIIRKLMRKLRALER